MRLSSATPRVRNISYTEAPAFAQGYGEASRGTEGLYELLTSWAREQVQLCSSASAAPVLLRGVRHAAPQRGTVCPKKNRRGCPPPPQASARSTVASAKADIGIAGAVGGGG